MIHIRWSSRVTTLETPDQQRVHPLDDQGIRDELQFRILQAAWPDTDGIPAGELAVEGVEPADTVVAAAEPVDTAVDTGVGQPYSAEDTAEDWPGIAGEPASVHSGREAEPGIHWSDRWSSIGPGALALRRSPKRQLATELLGDRPDRSQSRPCRSASEIQPKRLDSADHQDESARLEQPISDRKVDRP